MTSSLCSQWFDEAFDLSQVTLTDLPQCPTLLTVLKSLSSSSWYTFSSVKSSDQLYTSYLPSFYNDNYCYASLPYSTVTHSSTVSLKVTQVCSIYSQTNLVPKLYDLDLYNRNTGNTHIACDNRLCQCACIKGWDQDACIKGLGSRCIH